MYGAHYLPRPVSKYPRRTALQFCLAAAAGVYSCPDTRWRPALYTTPKLPCHMPMRWMANDQAWQRQHHPSSDLSVHHSIPFHPSLHLSTEMGRSYRDALAHASPSLPTPILDDSQQQRWIYCPGPRPQASTTGLS